MIAQSEILKTYKVIRDSPFAICIASIQDATGFGKRKVQRHAKLLTESDLVECIGDRHCDGYIYKVLPISAG